jgi:hypothetical protein
MIEAALGGPYDILDGLDESPPLPALQLGEVGDLCCHNGLRAWITSRMKASTFSRSSMLWAVPANCASGLV